MLRIFALSTAKGAEINISVMHVTVDRGAEQLLLASCVLLLFSWREIDYLDIARGSPSRRNGILWSSNLSSSEYKLEVSV